MVNVIMVTRSKFTPRTYFLRLSLSSVILIDLTLPRSPVHILMLSIQAVRGLPRLRAPGIVHCIISFSSWCDHSMLAALLWQCPTVLFYFSFVTSPLICFLIIIPAKAREYVSTGVGLCVCLCVCLPVTTITKKIVDGFVPNLGEREDEVRVSLRSVEGCGSNGRKNSINQRLFTFYTCTLNHIREL